MIFILQHYKNLPEQNLTSCHVVPIRRGFVSSFEFAVATKKGKENELNLITIGNV